MKKGIATLLLNYFKMCARIQLAKHTPRIVGITGSAGKSSTMEAVAAVLHGEGNIKVGRKANSESGIPLNILDLEAHHFTFLEWLILAVRAPLQLLINWQKHDWYVVEMGIDSPVAPKNMRYLLTILKPVVGIFTTVDAVHTEAFDPYVTEPEPRLRKAALIRAVATEKAYLINTLPSHGCAITSADNPVISEVCAPTARHVTFGFSKAATVRCTGVKYSKDGTEIEFAYQSKRYHLYFKNYALPAHYGATFAAAICLALYLELPLETALQRLQKFFTIPPGRATLLDGVHGCRIIDSSYNASAQPMLDFLTLLDEIPATRTIALLGDMRELGSLTKEEHVRVARHAATVLDEAVLVGPAMKEYVLPILVEAGCTTHWFPTAAQAALYLKPNLTSGDILLVKGSQNTLLLETAIAELLADSQTAPHVLCRRGAYWDNERAKLTYQQSIG